MTPLSNQKHLFSINEKDTYLNGAYMSPLLKSVERIGIQNLSLKNSPSSITSEHFYDNRVKLKKQFANLINVADHNDIALIPSVSYGLASVANNTNLRVGDEILVVDEQFPSNIYPWMELAAKSGATIKTISPPSASFEHRGKKWNASILEAIHSRTALIAIGHVHWADGTKFDLVEIGQRAREVGADLIIDGTQSIGALPFSVAEVKPDAVICGGYKWLLGPYSSGVAYYAKRFHKGSPIEHNWFNRLRSEDFQNLTNYQANYQVGAERFSVGESSNFILVPMLTESIKQLIEWQPERIQNYLKSITSEPIRELREKGCFVEEDAYRGQHLFGIYLPKHMDMDKIKQRLTDQRIYVSYRGAAIRVSPHVYNSREDMARLVANIY